jgi:hypothetical protein
MHREHDDTPIHFDDLGDGPPIFMPQIARFDNRPPRKALAPWTAPLALFVFLLALAVIAWVSIDVLQD